LAEKRSDLILHPLRLRILVALSGRELTSQQLAEQMSDVPQATLYRHLNRLAGAGLLKVVAERRVRGTVEKVYTLDEAQSTLTPEEMASASPDDHLRYFTTFAASLIGDYQRYLAHTPLVDPVADAVGYHKLNLELSDQEAEALGQALGNALLPFMDLPPAANRRRRLFSIILMPDEQNAPTASDRSGQPDPEPMQDTEGTKSQ
jgi:DNA-binding transcriptional ArsR family regulator